MADEQKSEASFLDRFLVLKGAVRELWIIFAAKLMGILAYGVMNSTLVLWLSSDLGYGDESAGVIVAMWSTVMTMFTVLVGSLVDAIGLRKAFLLGFCVCIGARGLLTFLTTRSLALTCGLLPLALGEALMTPVMVAAVRRYSTTAQRSISFSIFYVMMNLGFFLGGLIFDFVRMELGERGRFILPVIGVELSSYRVLFLISFLLTLPNFFITYFCLRDGVEATDEGVKITPEQPKYTGENLAKALGLMIRDAANDTLRIFAGLWRQPPFYKFLVFLSLAVAVRLIFFHMYYTYPKFGIRELGATATTFSPGEIKNVGALAAKLNAQADEVSKHLFSRLSEAGRQAMAKPAKSRTERKALQAVLARELNQMLAAGTLYDAQRFKRVDLRKQTRYLLAQNPKETDLVRLNRLCLEDAYPNNLSAGVPIGQLWTINSLWIVILVPIVGALSQRISAYKMVVVGSFISATSVFIMAMPTAWFQAMADGLPGHLVGHVWLGLAGPVNPYYVMIFTYVAVLSVGEALWSPRLYEYTAAVAPKGQEGSYMALSYLPFFVAKFFAGMFSGVLLARYCPETGPRDSQTLWLIIALTTMITPVGLIILRRYIQVAEAGRESPESPGPTTRQK